ncbi:gamma-glutamyl phosphate reductase [Jejuia pallidilutea]|nr:gamma-glutamyl phosphate reductase [Jejuia pallidilutea]GAL69924.1 gamma-glutamyl phosphate reductase [Jejuia pallidilutea]
MELLSTTIKNNVLQSMIKLLQNNQDALLEANKKDVDAFNSEDQAMYDRLIINEKKIKGMVTAVEEVLQQEDPVNQIISSNTLNSGLKV